MRGLNRGVLKMKFYMFCAAGVSAAAIGAAAYGAGAPPPVATYWMDVSTQSGFGAGLAGGGRPNMSQAMSMLGGGSSVSRTMQLRLASKQKAAAPDAQHLIPAALQMGPSLPLLTPQVAAATPTPRSDGLPQNYQPKGRMLIYWGCGELVGAAQPTVIDYSKAAAGKMPPGMAALVSSVQAAQPPHAGQAAGFGEWPNDKDSRAVPGNGSLVGSHSIKANYAPAMAFSLGAGQDFMPALGLASAGALPSGAQRLTWQPAAQATGYALMMMGAAGNGDMLMWTSAKSAAGFPVLDYLSPSQVKKLVTSGAVLAPSESQCTIPAEVAKASPTGMVMMIGYGPEAYFTDSPKTPKWATKVRYKTTASLMLGMPNMASPQQRNPQQQAAPQQPKKRRGFGLGDVLKQALPLPVPVR